jgi:hypothetical protein
VVPFANVLSLANARGFLFDKVAIPARLLLLRADGRDFWDWSAGNKV